MLAFGCRRAPRDPWEPFFDRRPDVILVVVDALRRDHVGAYGCPLPTSPFLDGLASTGVVFENAYAHASQTHTSTATMLASTYFPFECHNWQFQPIPGMSPDGQERHRMAPLVMEENVLLAEVLGRGGYQTAGFFTNPHHHATSGFWQGFQHPHYLAPQEGEHYAPADEVASAFLAWHARRDVAQPYFAYLHLMDVHNPYAPPPHLRRQFVTAAGRDRYTNGVPPAGEEPTADDLRFMKELYAACVRSVDDVLRTLEAELRRRGGMEHTLIVVTADHGDELMDHGGLGHGATLEKELVHVPLLLRLGEGERRRPWRGARVRQLVRHLDVAPTIVDLAGVAMPAEFQGVSLRPWLVEQAPAAVHPGTSYGWVGSLRSFTTEQWHCYVDLASGKLRLYDNRADPRGLVDLAPGDPARAAELTHVIQGHEPSLEASRCSDAQYRARSMGKATPPRVDPEIVKQLRDLGYLQ